MSIRSGKTIFRLGREFKKVFLALLGAIRGSTAK